MENFSIVPGSYVAMSAKPKIEDESDHLTERQMMQEMLEHSQRITEVTRSFPNRNVRCNEIALRQLGPIAAWGGELIVRGGTIEELKELIKAASAEMNVKISGFISILDDGHLVFHMSRWPRRIGLSVSSILDSRQILDRLIAMAKVRSIFSEVIRKEEEWGAPDARALLGLEEGYFDQRRKNIIANWNAAEEKSLESLIRTISIEIGSLEQFGVDIHSFQEASSLIESLQRTIFTTRHSIEEVIEGIGDSFMAQFIPADIYSIDQRKDYCYEEPAVIVKGPNSESFFAAVVKMGHIMHQARFSYEDLSCGAAWNVEILD